MTETITVPYRGAGTIEEGRKYIKGCVGPGWGPLLDRLVDDLLELGWNGKLLQVKEKFGGLRFYTTWETDRMSTRINQAEEESYRTCEHCGSPGEARGSGWISIRCNSCYKKERGMDY